MKLFDSSKIYLSLFCLLSLFLNLSKAFETPIFFNYPRIFDADRITIRPGSIDKLSPDGTISTAVSGLNTPSGLTFDDVGNLYYGNVKHNPLGFEIFKRTPEGMATNIGQVWDIPGGFSITGWGFDLAISPIGDVFFNHPESKTIDGITIRTGSIEKLSPDGTISTAVSSLNTPSGIAFDDVGNLYYGNVKHNPLGFEIFKRTPEGMATNIGQVWDIPGGFSITGWGFDLAISPIGDVFFNHPESKTIDGITIRTGSIEKLSPDGTISTVVSGLNTPSGIAFDDVGNLYYGNVKHDPLGFEIFMRTSEGVVTNLGQVVDKPAGHIYVTGWGFDIAIPEPATLMLLGLGGLALHRKRKI